MRLWLCVIVLASTTFAHRTEAWSSDEAPSEHHIHARDVEDAKLAASGSISAPIDVTMEGQYSWELIYHINNTGNNSPFKETQKIAKSITTSYSDLKKSILDSSVKSSLSVDVGGVFDVITASVKGSVDAELTTSYQTALDSKSETTVEEEITREFTVGANSIGEMYRMVFKGPGVSYATNTISTNGTIPHDKVFITCQVKRTPLLRDIEVVYTEESVERPRNLITETKNGSPDINSGLNGKFVWLVPAWTSSTKVAVTGIQSVQQKEHNDGYKDLAAGAGGNYRYLKMIRDPTCRTRIKRVGLLRSPDRVPIYDDRQKHGWDECTEDINKDRKGDFLHLCWNNIAV